MKTVTRCVLVAMAMAAAAGSPLSSSVAVNPDPIYVQRTLQKQRETGRSIDDGSVHTYQSSMEGYKIPTKDVKGFESYKPSVVHSKEKVELVKNDFPSTLQSSSGSDKKVNILPIATSNTKTSTDIDERKENVYNKRKNETQVTTIIRKKNQQVMQKQKNTIGIAIKHMFEIIKDITKIMIDMKTPVNALEKSDFPNNIHMNYGSNWPLIKTVFLRYLKFLRDTDLLLELRDIIPIAELENALEREDRSGLMHVMIKSITPKMFECVVDIVNYFFAPSRSTDVSNQISPELRQSVDTSVDIFWPVKFLFLKTFELFGSYFSSRSIDLYWDHFRSFSASLAGTLDNLVRLVYENQDNASNDLESTEVSRSDGSFPISYYAVAGAGTAMLASFLMYTMTQQETADRNKRSAVDGGQLYPWSNINFSDIYDALSSLETKQYTGNQEAFSTDYVTLDEKPKKITSKKYNPLSADKKLKLGIFDPLAGVSSS